MAKICEACEGQEELLQHPGIGTEVCVQCTNCNGLGTIEAVEGDQSHQQPSINTRQNGNGLQSTFCPKDLDLL